MLVRFTKVRVDFTSVLIKPFAASLVCGAVAYICSYILGLNLIISVVISAIIYLAFLLMLHTFSETEIKMVVNCKKIVIILEKLHLLG